MMNIDRKIKMIYTSIAEYRKALAPIKAFRTRQGAEFEIEEI